MKRTQCCKAFSFGPAPDSLIGSSHFFVMLLPVMSRMSLIITIQAWYKIESSELWSPIRMNIYNSCTLYKQSHWKSRWMITLNSNINLPMFPDPPWEQTSLDASQSLHCRDRWVNQGVCLELKVGESTKLNICESRRNGEEAQDKVQHSGHSWHGVCSRVRPSISSSASLLIDGLDLDFGTAILNW